jgi:hypothetical protein
MIHQLPLVGFTERRDAGNDELPRSGAVSLAVHFMLLIH